MVREQVQTEQETHFGEQRGADILFGGSGPPRSRRLRGPAGRRPAPRSVNMRLALWRTSWPGLVGQLSVISVISCSNPSQHFRMVRRVAQWWDAAAGRGGGQLISASASAWPTARPGPGRSPTARPPRACAFDSDPAAEPNRGVLQQRHFQRHGVRTPSAALPMAVL